MSGFLQTLLNGANQGLVWALLALGVFMTYRLLNFADLTAEGSFTLGGVVAAALISSGVNAFVAIIVSFLAGAVAGLCTGLLNTKLKIPPILSGILTMIALYSINLRILGGKSNVSLLNANTVLKNIQNLLHIPSMYSNLIAGIVLCALIVGALYWFFGTERGASVRATGSNEKMCGAQGINTDNNKILTLMISNGLIALSGAMVCQQQGYADVGMGIGAIVVGLASVIIGETIISSKRPFGLKLTGIIVGSVIYWMVIALVIYTNFLKASDIKLLTAIIVVLFLSIPLIKSFILKKFGKKSKPKDKGPLPSEVSIISDIEVEPSNAIDDTSLKTEIIKEENAK